MKNLILVLFSIFLFSCNPKNEVLIKSPDGKIDVHFGINEIYQIYYSVQIQDSMLIAPSEIKFQIENDSDFGENLAIVSFSEKKVNQTWKPVYGERTKINDHYNQIIIHLKETVEPNNEYEIICRVYNEGVAFNTTFLARQNTNSLIVKSEKTEFNFTQNYNSWVSDRAQSPYRKQKINSIDKPAERPMVVEAGENFIAIGEAKLVDFARMKFLSGEKENSLVTELNGDVKITLPYTTPWRTIMIAKSPGELLENNYFLENLNDSCAIEDVSWIKPGKVIREVTLTTKGGKACVDFAVKNGLQYVEFDAGWYGPENDNSSDASTITVDPKRSPGPLDLQEVINYGKSKNIGTIVYVNRRALEQQLDEILPLFNKWGIKGVKYGFVNVGSQDATKWLHDAVKKAAENELMVDIHDEYRPTGFSRTYPNLVTQEGIRGDEESPSNEHTLITLFTRMIAGAGDNTNCYYAPRVTEKMGGHISQLAKAVMLYSPWQFLFWYDRPPQSSANKGAVPGSDGFIQNHPELDFYKQMPTVWDETKVLEGKIGEFATLARKTGEDWFLGSLSGKKSKSIEINLDFLDKDSKYKATIYSHDSESNSSTKVNIETKMVNSNGILHFTIIEESGLAIYFEKIEE